VSAQVATVRAWWHVKRPGPTLGARLDTLYMVAISTGIIGALLYGTASSALSRWVTPVTVPEWGPAIVLVTLATTARWGTWQGPVVFAEPDVGFLLGAPLSRRALAARPFARSVGWGAVVGLLVAAVTLVGLGGRGRGVDAGEVTGLALGLALVGALAVAGAGHVECSARASRVAGVALPLSVAVGVGMVLAARSGGAARTAVLWSGPWGWAFQPVAGGTAAAVAALVALAVVAAAAIFGVARGFGGCATERHVVRAEAHAGVRASAWAFDARTARLALQRAGGPGARRALTARGPRPPRRAALAVPWRDASSGLRAPARTLGAAAVAGAASALAVAAGRHPAADAIAALGTYLAAGIVLEPLRLEVDQPSVSQVLLRRPFGHVLLAHLAIPIAVVAAGAAAGAAVVVAFGDVARHGGALALVALAVVPTVVGCAALSARRGGRVPISVLAAGSAGDPTGGGGTVIAWILRWPAAAAVLGGLPLVIVASSGALSSTLPIALVVAAGAPPVLGALLLRSER
jgi:hypothetical protein